MHNGRRHTGGYSDAALDLVAATATALELRRGQRSVAHRPPRNADAHQRVRWCVDQYPQRYRAVVVSDVHPAAAHLAVALDVPWLPLPDAGRPPAAYRCMLEEALLLPDAPVLMITTGGTPSDPSASLARHAMRSDHPPILVRGSASQLSATVAQLYRGWLRRAGKTGDRLIVECGSLTDLWHVVRAGLVPYWCPVAVPRYADDLAWWLAGEQRYSSIELLLQPPGGPHYGDELAHWQAVAAFASRRGVIEPGCRRAYRRGPLPSRHATHVLRQYPYDLPLPAPLSIQQAMVELSA